MGGKEKMREVAWREMVVLILEDAKRKGDA